MTTTTETQSPAAVVRAFYEALGRGDIAAVKASMSPEITVHMPGKSPLAGLYSGPDAVVGFLGRMQELAGGTFRAELREVFTNGDQVVAVHHGTGTRGGRQLDADAALLFEVTGGQVTSCTVHQARQDGWDDFFS